MRDHRIVWAVVVLGVVASLAFGAPRRSFDRAVLPEGGDVWHMAGGSRSIVIEGVWVNGQGPYRFLLDTGTTGGVRIDARVATALGLDAAGQTKTGARRPGSGPTLDTIELDSLEVGGVRWEGVSGAVRTLSHEQTPAEHRIDGVLAWHLFVDWTLTLDLGAREVRVRDEALPRPGREGVVFMRGDRDGPTAPLVVGRVKVNALIDTGNGGGVLINSRFRARAPIEGELVEAGFVSTVDGTSPVLAAALSEPMTLAGVELGQGRGLFTDGIYPANVGLGVLAGGVVEIDAANSRIRLTLGANAQEAGGEEPAESGLDAAGGIDDDDEDAPADDREPG
ncbi:MAG: retropepsin-like aspartic protease [Phycisphaerales bacterium]